MRNVAIIPARSGSKRLRNKNTKILFGKPLISWTLESVIESDLFEKIIVSTDNKEIAELSSGYGITVDELRPDFLSSDTTPICDVLKYHLLGSDYDNGCLLQPTSPLRTVKDLCKSFEIMVQKKANSVISISPNLHPTDWIYDESISFDCFLSNLKKKRSQDYRRTYRLNGAIYWFNIVAFKKFNTHLIPKKSYPYIMPVEKGVDIDCEFDFKFAESLISSMRNGN